MSSSTTSKWPLLQRGQPALPVAGDGHVDLVLAEILGHERGELGVVVDEERGGPLVHAIILRGVAVMRAHEGGHLLALAGVERVVHFGERLHDGVADLLHLGLALRLQRGELGLIDLVGGEHGDGVVEVRGVIVEAAR